MHQKQLLTSTLRFITPSDKKIKGIKLHEAYSVRFKLMLGLLFVSSIFLAVIFESQVVVIFGSIILFIGIFGELLLRLIYRFDGSDAVKYYAVQMYEDPSETHLKQLHSWNKNPFNLSNEYYYPRIGHLVENSSKKEDSVEYVSRNIPDEIRLIEQQESDDFNEFIELTDNKILEIEKYYQDLITEANYCYKFGAYTSVSVLSRKIVENLIVDVLIAKGLYSELSSEYHFEEMVELFLTEVISNEDLRDELDNSLDVWIRKKGNKGAHKRESFKKEEIEELVEHTSRVIEILLVIRTDATLEN